MRRNITHLGPRVMFNPNEGTDNNGGSRTLFMVITAPGRRLTYYIATCWLEIADVEVRGGEASSTQELSTRTQLYRHRRPGSRRRHYTVDLEASRPDQYLDETGWGADVGDVRRNRDDPLEAIEPRTRSRAS